MLLNDLVLLENFLCCFNLRRLTLGIGNFMSSHSLSAGHVPLGLGRDIDDMMQFDEDKLPDKFKIPQLQKFDRTGDPKIHLS